MRIKMIAASMISLTTCSFHCFTGDKICDRLCSSRNIYSISIYIYIYIKHKWRQDTFLKKTYNLFRPTCQSSSPWRYIYIYIYIYKRISKDQLLLLWVSCHLAIFRQLKGQIYYKQYINKGIKHHYFRCHLCLYVLIINNLTCQLPKDHQPAWNSE